MNPSVTADPSTQIGSSPADDRPSSPVSLAAALGRAAREHPDHGIVYLDPAGPAQTQSYAALQMDAARILTGLRALGVRPGDPLIFQIERAADFIPAFWACALGGFVPAPVSISPTYEQAHSVLGKLANSWRLLEQPIVLAGAALAPRLEAFAAREALPGFRVAAIEDLRQHPAAEIWHDSTPGDLALLLLTSGSTGLPKAVAQTQRNLLAWAASVAQACEFDAADVSLNWMPLDHVGGLVMFHLRDVVLGCRQIHAPTEAVLQNPLLWLDWIDRYRATITWAPNFAFGLVNDHAAEIAERRWNLSAMRFILNGGEAIVSRTARRFLQLLAPHQLPATAMRPAWGMSETCSGVTYSRRFTLATTNDHDPFVEVGAPISGVELRIVDPADAPVPDGRTGRLQIRGISITPGYHRNPEANRLAFTADGWFITGDLGVMRDGQLAITGREKDVIIVNGLNFYCHEIEAVVEEVAGVEISFTAACPIRVNGENTDRIAIFFSPAEDRAAAPEELIRAIRAAVVRKEGVNPDYVIPLAKAEIPKTAIGKIQRSQLKQNLERGDYAAAIARLSPVRSAPSAGQTGYFRPVWREAPIAGGGLPAGAGIVLLRDDRGLADALARALAADGHACTLVTAAERFARTAADGFSLDPADPAHYRRLLAELGRAPDIVVHAWCYDQAGEPPRTLADLAAAQARGAYSLLGLVPALLAAGPPEHAVRLVVAATGMRGATPADRIDFGKAPLLGLLRTIPHETSRIACRHIDLEPGEPADGARRVLAELRAADANPESAWRGERRLAPFLERFDPTAVSKEPPLVAGGTYLLSGGLGGIGRWIAGHLLRHYRAHLIIVGRTPLPPRPRWADYPPDQPHADLVRAGQELAASGGEFDYVCADAADLPSVATAVALAERRWNRPLDGIFHLAGRYRECPLEQESARELAAVLHPKMDAAWTLHQVAIGRPGCLFVSFSSLISQFGSFSTGAYAAANSFLDAFSHHQRHACGLRAYNALWSSWTDTGMSQTATESEALRSRGYQPLAPADGVAALMHMLGGDEAQCLIGLDGSHKLIQRHLGAGADPLAGRPASADAPGRLAPRNATERKLAALWEELLDVRPIGVRDNFFELGGRSLLAAKMFARLHQAFGKNLPIPALFKAPTIEKLAIVLLEQPATAAVKIQVLQVGGDRPPLFLVPEPRADPAAFQPLVGQLGADQPCFVLQARSLAPGSPPGPPVSIDELGEHLAREIALLAPAGSCALGGRAFGAVLAWAAARRLAEGGRPATRLFLLAPPPSAFFAPAGPGSSGAFRLIKPAAAESGLLGRLWRKEPASAGAVTKPLRLERDCFADARLEPLAGSVTVFGPDDAPWRALAPADCTHHPAEEIAARLPALLPA